MKSDLPARIVALAALCPMLTHAASIVLGTGENITLTDGNIDANGSILASEKIEAIGASAWIGVGVNNAHDDGGCNAIIGYDNWLYSSYDEPLANVVSGAGNWVSAWSSLVSGSNNQINSVSSLSKDSIVAGQYNTVTDYNAAIVLGAGNTLKPEPNSSYEAFYGVILGGYNFVESNTAWVMGVNNNATGLASTTLGWNLRNHTHSAVVLGVSNEEISGSATAFSDTSPALVVGNGDLSVRSNAVTTLKNGQTTLANKAWKANVAASGDPLDDPSSSTDNGGNALVVDGHTVLNGKVVISEPQGDISMGIYE
jgi:hypothetical protein